MDALKMPAVAAPRPAALACGGTVVLARDELSLAPRIAAAFAALLEALEYAQDLETTAWDFAVDIASLRRLKLSDADLRWLIVRGLAEHAIELTAPRAATRTFRPSESTVFARRSCFVMTAAGAVLARELRGDDEDDAVHTELPLAEAPVRQTLPTGPRVPHWNRDRRELCIGGRVVKRFNIPAVDLESILTAFEEQAWPDRIDDPLPPCDDVGRKQRLECAIQRLYKGQRRPLLRLTPEGGGNGIQWELGRD